MKTSRRQIDMLHGPLLKKIVLFALPIAMSSILQQLFNAADTAVVGRFAGSDSLAAVGANGVVISLLVNLFIGMSVGTNVLLATAEGRRDREGMVKALHTSVLFSVLCGIALGVLGFFIAPLAHQLIGTGEAGTHLRAQAVLYLRIYFAGMPFMLLYNFESAILRSKGDTRRPLIVLTASGVLNLVLNLVLVVGFHMTVDGVAIATVASNAFSAIVLFWLLCREEGAYRLKRESLRLDGRTLLQIVRIGLPAGVQSSMFSVANVIVQASVNALGPAVIAGTTVGLYVEIFGFAVLNGFSQAATTFVGQNYGAGDLPRCRKITRICVLCGAVGTFVLTGILALLRAPFVAIFTQDAAVAAVACVRIVYVGIYQAVNGIGEIFSGSMRGMQRSLVPALISIISICGVRLLWIFVFYPANRTYEHLIFAYPLSWVVSLAAMTVAYFLVRRKAEGEARGGGVGSKNGTHLIRNH